MPTFYPRQRLTLQKQSEGYAGVLIFDVNDGAEDVELMAQCYDSLRSGEPIEFNGQEYVVGETETNDIWSSTLFALRTIEQQKEMDDGKAG